MATVLKSVQLKSNMLCIFCVQKDFLQKDIYKEMYPPYSSDVTRVITTCLAG